MTGATRMDKLPIDRGWAWMVVLGSHGIYLTIAVVTRAMGILFAEIIKTYGVSALAASWIPSLQLMCMLVFSPIVGCVCNKFSCRIAAYIGAFLSSLGCLISVFAETVEILYLSFGVLTGLGFGFMLTASISVLPIFFERRRAAAFGIVGAGSGLGSIMGPILARFLLDEYGLNGCMLLLVGVCLNNFVLASLYRDINLYGDKNVYSISDEEDQSSVCEKTDLSNISETVKLKRTNIAEESLELTIPKNHNLGLKRLQANVNQISFSSHPILNSKDQENDTLQIPVNDCFKHRSLDFLHIHTLSNKNASLKTATSLGGSIGEFSMLSVSVLAERETFKTEENNENSSMLSKLFCCCNNRSGTNSEGAFKWYILKNPAFLLIMAASACMMFTSPCIVVMLPSHAMDYGISEQMASLVVSLAVIPEPFSRMFIGWFADLKIISSLHIFAFSLCATGALLFALPYLQSFPLLMTYGCIQWSVNGITFGMNPVVLADLLGLDGFANAFTLCLLAQGFLYLMAPPITGLLYDTTGSWMYSMFFCGAGSLLASSLAFVASFIHKRKNNDNNKKLDEAGNKHNEVLVGKDT